MGVKASSSQSAAGPEETTFSHNDEKALVCVAGTPGPAYLAVCKPFIINDILHGQSLNGKSRQTTVTDYSSWPIPTATALQVHAVYAPVLYTDSF